MTNFYDKKQLKIFENGIELKIKCNCCLGIQSTTWEWWEVKVNDFYNGFLDIYREIYFYNYCHKCGKKIDKEKYIKLIKIKKASEEE